MPRTYLTFKGQLISEQDIHIGYGGDTDGTKEFTNAQNTKVNAVLVQNSRDNVELETYAATIRGADKKPIIPVTSLKGVWMAATADLKFWGKAKSTDAPDDKAGALFLDPCIWESCSAPPSDILLWDKDAGTFILPHNRMDDRGVAQLFYKEYIPAGSIFSFSGRFDLDRGADEVKLFNALIRLAQGLDVGSSTGSAHGRICLDVSTLKLRRITLPTLDLSQSPPEVSPTEETEVIAPPENSTADYKLTLTAETPFFIRDPWRHASKQGDGTIQAALRRCEGDVALTGEAVKYALRELADILLITNDKQVAPQKQFTIATALDPTERLFGIPGFKGLVSIDIKPIPTAKPERKLVHGVKLSPWTAAPIDGAKYLTEGYWGHQYLLELSLDSRVGADAKPSEENGLEEGKPSNGGTSPAEENTPNKNDSANLKMLVKHIKSDGIELGAETGTGFGWFSVIDQTQKEESDAR